MSHTNKIRASMTAAAAILAIAAPVGAACAAGVTAAGYAVLHQFQKSDGSAPWGELVQARDGSFYGTAFESGDSDAGTVFKIAPDGTFTLLHTFVVTDGIAPATGLTPGVDGNLYGLTGGGGDYAGGTAFKITPGGEFTLLHSFGGPANDGAYPYLGAMTQGMDGSFYGTTMQGGAANLGVAFKMTPSGQVTVLHSFAGGAKDGGNPRGGLMLASDGNFYGTTLCGGIKPSTKGCGGTLYKITAKGVFSIVYRFGAADAPQSTLAEAGGFLYGTTSAGGTAKAGTIFKSSFDGRTVTSLYSFTPGVFGKPRKPDGSAPTGRLLLASDGNLYGTTSMGGVNTSADPNGDGTIFRITQAGVYSVIHTFGASTADGARPYSGLTQGQDGNLYGTTHNGAYQSDGTVFKLSLPAAR